MRRAWLDRVLVVAAIVCAGCDGGEETTSSSSSSSTSSGAGGSGGAFAACETQHSVVDGGKEVIVCDQAFPAAPRVHLPAATSARDYMALVGCHAFVDREGVSHDIASGSAASAPCDAEMGLPGPEATGHAFAIYETTLDASGDVTGFERWAIVDEKNILAPLAGATLEGTISKKKPDGTFELAASLPVRVTLGAPVATSPQDDGTTVYTIAGTIQNVSGAVTAADGSCLPALSADAADPFPGAGEITLTFSRVPSMHLQGDDEAVFEIAADGVGAGSCMAPAWFRGPETLIVSPEPPLTDPYEGMGHGTPGSIPTLHLELVTGGGAPCTP